MMYLSLDVGTHAVKAALVASCGTIHSLQSIDVGLSRISAQEVEQDPEEILAALRSVVVNVLEQSQEPVLAAGLAIQRSTVVAWDRVTGEALSQALSWQDTRGQSLVNTLDEHQYSIESRSGLVLSAHYGASKIHWLQQRYSGENVCISPLVSYLLFHLLESPIDICDESNASRTQLWNLEQRAWDAQLCSFFCVDPKRLPTVKPVVFDYGVIAHSLTQGLSIPIKAVVGDQNAALVGALDDQSTLLVNIGSGAFVLAYDTRGSKPQGLLRSLAYSDAQSFTGIVEGTVNGAGLAVSWLANTVLVKERGGEPWLFSELPFWLSEPSDETLFYNVVGGLGSPFWRPGGQPVFVPEDVPIASKAVAVIESIVFLLAINVKRILGVTAMSADADAHINTHPNEKRAALMVSGGLSRLDGLCQRLADLSLCPVVRGDSYETTLLGVARLASQGRVSPSQNSRKQFNPVHNVSLFERFNRFRKMMNNYTLVAHRGYAEQYPENSLLAISKAVACGVNAVEFDLQMSKDGVPVVFHDLALERLAGVQGNIDELDLAEIKQLSVHEPARFGEVFLPTPIPTLQELIDSLPLASELMLFPEVKDEMFHTLTREQVLDAIWPILKPLAAQCMIISYDLAFLRLVQDRSLCKVGWVLSDYDDQSYQRIQSKPVDVVICNHRRFPLKGIALWDGPWDWFAYEISTQEMLQDCIARGVKWIESRNPVAFL